LKDDFIIKPVEEGEGSSRKKLTGLIIALIASISVALIGIILGCVLYVRS